MRRAQQRAGFRGSTLIIATGRMIASALASRAHEREVLGLPE
jgi:hypothetical protein